MVINRAGMIGLVAGLASGVGAAPIDFSTFVEWNDAVYPLCDGFAVPLWEVRDGGATAVNVGNSVVSIYYDGSIEANGQRITGTIFPGDDDDGVGLVFGYTIDDDFNENADYLYLDWKGVDQSFDFSDIAENAGFFHDLTSTTFMGQGIRLARVTGFPTADELWGAVNLPQNDNVPALPAGGVEQIARAIDLGNVAYPRVQGRGFKFDIDLTPTNIKVWVNGVLQLNVDAPADRPFDTRGFGLMEQYQDSAFDDQGLWQNFEINPSDGSTPSGEGIDDILPPPFVGLDGPSEVLAASKMELVDNNRWAVTESTGRSRFVVTSNANAGDVELRSTTGFVDETTGVVMATRSLNQRGNAAQHVTAVRNSAFGGFGETSLATNFANTNAEGQVPFDAVYFPYAEGWLAARYNNTDATLGSSPVNATVTPLQTPDAGDLDGLYDLVLADATPGEGVLLVIGAENNADVASAIPTATGWRIFKRNGGSNPINGAEEAGEAGDFAFVFVPTNSPATLAGGTVGANGAVSGGWGDFSVTREQAGRYRLSIPGFGPREGALLLSSSQPASISDPDGLIPGVDEVPANNFMSFQADGEDFIVQTTELNGVNEPRDGGFTFAFVPFRTDAPFPGCNPADLAAPFGRLDIFDVLEFFTVFAQGCN